NVGGGALGGFRTATRAIVTSRRSRISEGTSKSWGGDALSAPRSRRNRPTPLRPALRREARPSRKRGRSSGRRRSRGRTGRFVELDQAEATPNEPGEARSRRTDEPGLMMSRVISVRRERWGSAPRPRCTGLFGLIAAKTVEPSGRRKRVDAARRPFPGVLAKIREHVDERRTHLSRRHELSPEPAIGPEPSASSDELVHVTSDAD